MDEVHSIGIREINPHIVCSLCAGYFIDATTVCECLHTFCKSCIVKFLQSSKYCPQCNIKIHETQPLVNLKPDRVMQDIVYKLVPGLFENEEKKRQEFNRSRGLIKAHTEEDVDEPLSAMKIIDNAQGHFYRNDEQIYFCLEKFHFESVEKNGGTKKLENKFMRCSVRAEICHLRQLLRNSLGLPVDTEVEIVCNNKVMDKDMTMKQIWLMQYTGKPSPMMLYYKIMPKTLAAKENFVQCR